MIRKSLGSFIKHKKILAQEKIRKNRQEKDYNRRHRVTKMISAYVQ